MILGAALIAGCGKPIPLPEPVLPDRPVKEYDLVLVHGLSNKHRWSDAFLAECLNHWGTGRVFVVCLTERPDVSRRTVNGKLVAYSGREDRLAGHRSVEEQTDYLERSVEALRSKGLKAPFDVIAHSMGGLVARNYIDRHPGSVAGLVTIATPHHGSPLATSFDWVGPFLGGRAAVRNLTTEFAAEFNRTRPVAEARLHRDGPICVIRGGCPEGRCFGWGGELALGWTVLKNRYGLDSDGLVPRASAVIDGAVLIADFPSHDHLELVQDPDVAAAAAAWLP
jgi:pimeloyl-ACP methyl ester carboxylesterase